VNAFKLEISAKTEGQRIHSVTCRVHSASSAVKTFLEARILNHEWSEALYTNLSGLSGAEYTFLSEFKYPSGQYEKNAPDSLTLICPVKENFLITLGRLKTVIRIDVNNFPMNLGKIHLLKLKYKAENNRLEIDEPDTAYLLLSDMQAYLIGQNGVETLISPLRNRLLPPLFENGSIKLSDEMRDVLFEQTALAHIHSMIHLPKINSLKNYKIVFYLSQSEGRWNIEAFIEGSSKGQTLKHPLNFSRLRQLFLMNDHLVFSFDKESMDRVEQGSVFYESLKAVVFATYDCFFELLNELRDNRIQSKDRESIFERFLPLVKDMVEIRQNGKSLRFIRIEKVEKNILIHDKGLSTDKPINWLEIKFEFKAGKHLLTYDEVRLLLEQNYIHKNDELITLDTISRQELELFLSRVKPQKINGRLMVHSVRLPVLMKNNIKLKLPDPLKSLSKDLKSFGRSFVIEPDIKSLLRDYQTKAVEWLAMLYHYGFSGILADEMGLGKTLEVLTFIHGTVLIGPVLIVCPSALVLNWAAEIDKFFNHRLSYTLISGPKHGREEKIQNLKAGDIAITSYHLAHLDEENYADMLFQIMVLDEAQHIKNRSAKRTRSVKTIPSTFRVAVTGTPIENNIDELWSIFDFLMPDFLGSQREFREHFSQVINGFDRKKCKAAFKELHQLIGPFVLRRTKKDVYSELPDKIEQDVILELSDTQKQMYLSTLDQVKVRYQQAVMEKGENKSGIDFLAGLTRLRQICLHPRLLNGEIPELPLEELSVKLAALIELVEESIDSGHRMLVFSQFVSMLSLIRREFHRLDIPYLHLDGKTKNRVAMVDHFNDSDIPVFLISLRAGGTGLNLTGADTVVLFDPWWNPAVEQQAIDRAHRIGQKHKVQVFRLLTKGTIEEKIQQLQKRKRNVFDSVLASSSVFAALSSEEREKLLMF